MARHLLPLLFASLLACGASPALAAAPAANATAPAANTLRAGDIYYAAKEEPDQFRYKVYLRVIDDRHFSWWRTREEPAAVLARLDEIDKTHPGANLYSTYTVVDGQVSAGRDIATRGESDIRDHVFRQTFKGKLEGDKLTLRLENWTEYDDGEKAEPIVWGWKMVKISDK